MNRSILLAIAMTFTSGLAMAENSTDSRGVTTSDDPARIAAVEQHAQQLQAQQMRGVNASGTSSKRSAKHHKTSKAAKKAQQDKSAAQQQ